VRQGGIKTLYLEANGCGSPVIKADTILRGLFGYEDGAVPPKLLRRSRRVVNLFAHLRSFDARLSYVADWRDAFRRARGLDVEVCNINNLVHYGRCLLGIRQYDLIIIGHTAAGDDMTVLSRTGRWFGRRRAKLVMFIGNEYDLLEEKIRFARSVEAEFVCSQLPIEAASYLYAECERSRILSMPHALNPAAYFPRRDVARDIDIGFVGDLYWPFVGDRERTELIEFFRAHATEMGLACDVRTERLSRDGWAAFLNRCKGVIGAESGTYYLNDRGRLLAAAREWNLNEKPNARFEEVYERFYRDQPRLVSGKSISSRHFEPIGTKTCQILLEGEYNGILKQDVHYISVKRDLSNIGDALRRFRDGACREAMVEETYDYVVAEHTYDHRVRTLLRTIA
jgi:hypothetical protein